MVATPTRPHSPEQIDIEDLDGSDILVTRRGFKLRVVPIPADLIQKARERIPKPKAPLVPDKEKEGQFFENTLHPTYQREMDEYYEVYNELTFRVMASYGITAYGVPEGSYPPESEEWVTELQDDETFTVNGTSYALVDIPPATQPKARFFAWLRYHVLAQDDLQPFWDAVLHGTGTVLEKDVEAATESFPGRNGRDSVDGAGKPAKDRKAPAA